MITSRRLTKLVLVFSVSSQVILYWLSISENYAFVPWMSFRPGVGYPIWEFITTEPGPLDDFSSYLFASRRLQLFPTVAGFVLYPFAFLTYLSFSFMSDTLGAVLFFFASGALVIRCLSKLGLDSFSTLAIITSYPVLFTISRGNNELLLLGAGLFLLRAIVDSRRSQRIIGRMALISLFEPVPATLFWGGGTFGQRMRRVLATLLIVLLTILVTGSLISPHNPQSYLNELVSYGSGSSSTPYPGSSLFSTSLQSGIRVAHYLFGSVAPEYSDHLIINDLIFYLGCLSLVYFGMSKMYSLIDRMILTSSCWLICYSTSFDYRLTWLMAPMALILRTYVGRIPLLRVLQTVLIAVICSPMAFVWWPNDGGHHIGSLLKPLLLLGLLFLTAVKGRAFSSEEIQIDSLGREDDTDITSSPKKEFRDAIQLIKQDSYYSRLMTTAFFVALWFGIRANVLGFDSDWATPIEVGVLIALIQWTSASRSIQVPGGSSNTVWMLLSTTFVFISLHQHETISHWSVSSPRMSINLSVVSLIGATLVSFCAKQFSNLYQDRPSFNRVFQNTTYVLSGLAVFWTIPAVIQPPYAWLNIGSSTERVLDEILGPAIGNLDNMFQPARFSAVLGLPLLPLRYVFDDSHEILKVATVWVNGLVLSVPLLIGFVIRRISRRIPTVLAVAIGFLSVSVSSRQDDNSVAQSESNFSLFRELSYLSYVLLPLLLGLVLVLVFGSQNVTSKKISMVIGVACLAIINNPTFGLGAAIAASLVCHAYLRLRSDGLWKLFVFPAAISASVLLPDLLQTIGLIKGGQSQLFSILQVADDSAISGPAIAGVPVIGLAAVTYSLAITLLTLVLREYRNHENWMMTARDIAVAFFGLWLVMSSPAFLTIAIGPFGSQLLLIPLFVLVVASFSVNTDPSHPVTAVSVSAARFNLVHASRPILFPMTFLAVYLGSLIFSTPNGIGEWERVLASSRPTSIFDQWSEHQVDWIRPSDVKLLSESLGGDHKIGWWSSHGNAIELLTGVMNVSGTSAFQIIQSNTTVQKYACDSVVQSGVSHVVTESRYVPLLRNCKGVRRVSLLLRSSSQPDLILVGINP